jgi:hypothetical protein
MRRFRFCEDTGVGEGDETVGLGACGDVTGSEVTGATGVGEVVFGT